MDKNTYIDSVRAKFFHYGPMPDVAAAEMKIGIGEDKHVYLLVSVCGDAKVAMLSEKSYYASFIFEKEDDTDAAEFDENSKVMERFDFDDYRDSDYSGCKYPEYYDIVDRLCVDVWEK